MAIINDFRVKSPRDLSLAIKTDMKIKFHICNPRVIASFAKEKKGCILLTIARIMQGKTLKLGKILVDMPPGSWFEI